MEKTTKWNIAFDIAMLVTFLSVFWFPYGLWVTWIGASAMWAIHDRLKRIQKHDRGAM
jgi:hypothetical protein